MASFTVSKLDVARRQLVVAIRLYFNWGDEISIHTLVSASRNVLANLCLHKGIKVALMLEEMINELVKPEHRTETLAKFREPENFFKHADRDPEGQLTFNPHSTEFALLEAVEAYQTITGERIPEFHTYRGWWVLHHQDCLQGASEEYLRKLNGVRYEGNRRTQFFHDMLAAIAAQG